MEWKARKARLWIESSCCVVLICLFVVAFIGWYLSEMNIHF
jgi:hypothetical protein